MDGQRRQRDPIPDGQPGRLDLIPGARRRPRHRRRQGRQPLGRRLRQPGCQRDDRRRCQRPIRHRCRLGAAGHCRRARRARSPTPIRRRTPSRSAASPAGSAAEKTETPGDPFGVAFGADGAYWIPRFAAGDLVRLTTTGKETTLGGLSAGAGPRRIATGPNNTLWVTEDTANKVARITGLEPPKTAKTPKTKFKSTPGQAHRLREPAGEGLLQVLLERQGREVRVPDHHQGLPVAALHEVPLAEALHPHLRHLHGSGPRRQRRPHRSDAGEVTSSRSPSPEQLPSRRHANRVALSASEARRLALARAGLRRPTAARRTRAAGTCGGCSAASA